MSAPRTGREPSDTKPRHDGLLALVTAFVIAASSLTRIHDPDLFWHLGIGRWLVEHGRVPFPDPFSDNATIPFSHADFLADLAFYAVHQGGGFVGLNVFVALLVGGLALVVFRTCRVDGESGLASAGLATCLWGAACQFRFVPKTDLFTLVGLGLLLLLLRSVEGQRDKRLLLLTGPLVLVWSCLHRGSSIALVVIGSYLVSSFFQREKRPLRAYLGLALLLALLAILLSPGGAATLLDAVQLLKRASYRAHFAEWRPPALSFFALIDPAWTALALLGVADAFRRRRLDGEVLCALLLLALGFRAVRFLPLAALALTPGAARMLEAIGERLRPRLLVRPSVARWSLTGLGAFVVAFNFLHAVPAGAAGIGLLTFRVPVGAGAFLKKYPPPGRMWNSFNFGGYLLFATERRVFIDGRNDLSYGDRFFAEALNAEGSTGLLLPLLDRRKIDFLVLRCTRLEEPGLGPLLDEGGFRLVYLDDLAAVLVRDRREFSDYLARHSYRYLRPDRTLSQLTRGLPATDLEQLAPELERNVEEAPTSVRAHLYRGLLARRFGDERAYEAEAAFAKSLAAERGTTLTLR